MLSNLMVYTIIVTMHKSSQIARFMGPTWGPPGADRTQVGPMLAPWTLLSGMPSSHFFQGLWDQSHTAYYIIHASPCQVYHKVTITQSSPHFLGVNNTRITPVNACVNLPGFPQGDLLQPIFAPFFFFHFSSSHTACLLQRKFSLATFPPQFNHSYSFIFPWF